MAIAAGPGERLRSLAERHGMDARQLDRLAALLAALERDERAPTAVSDAGRAVDVHVADSLACLEFAAARPSGRVVDIGSGAGFPGLPLAVALPTAKLLLLESQARKCAFLERMAALLELDNVEVVCARAETWPDGLGTVDVGLARALAPQPVVLEYAAPLLRLGGRLVDWRARRDEADERAALLAAEALGLRREAVGRVCPFAGARERHLHVFAKVADTPARFPRRPGVARKRPLGAGAAGKPPCARRGPTGPASGRDRR